MHRKKIPELISADGSCVAILLEPVVSRPGESGATSGDPVAIDLTLQVQAWADIPFDSIVTPITFMFRAFPEGSAFGYWNFGAVDGDPAFRPTFRIVFTPNREIPVR